MKTKFLLRNIFFIYIVCQILCNIYFLCLHNSISAEFAFWIFTIIGSILFGVKACACEFSDIFSFHTSQHIVIKIVLYCQIISVLFLVYFCFGSVHEINTVLEKVFYIFHLPEYIFSEILSQGIYYLNNMFDFHSINHILHYSYSIYPLTAIVLFVEIYYLSSKKAVVWKIYILATPFACQSSVQKVIKPSNECRKLASFEGFFWLYCFIGFLFVTKK